MSLYYDVGLYLGQVTAQAMGETKNGNTQFVLTFNVLGKIDQTEPDKLIQCEQYQRSVFMVFTEKTIDFLLEQLQSIGFHKPSFSFLDPSRPDHQSFVGQEIEFWCKHSEWEGKVSEKWSISNGGGMKPVQPAAIRKLDAMYGAKLKGAAVESTKSSKTKQAASVESEEVTPENRESIPF